MFLFKMLWIYSLKSRSCLTFLRSAWIFLAHLQDVGGSLSFDNTFRESIVSNIVVCQQGQALILITLRKVGCEKKICTLFPYSMEKYFGAIYLSYMVILLFVNNYDLKAEIWKRSFFFFGSDN